MALTSTASTAPRIQQPSCSLHTRCAVYHAVRAIQHSQNGRRDAWPPPPLRSSVIVDTSEFWYEEEEEFDSVTDAMRPKTVVVASPAHPNTDDSSLEALRSYLKPLAFNQAFSSEANRPFAEQLWRGRDRAPYFLKVRTRPALDAASSGAAGAATEVWAELLQQNWRVELDAGLGGSLQEREALLIVCSPQCAVQLLASAGAEAAAGPAPALITVLQVSGTQAGEAADWRLLDKQLVVVADVDTIAGEVASGGDILAALRQHWGAVEGVH